MDTDAALPASEAPATATEAALKVDGAAEGGALGTAPVVGLTEGDAEVGGARILGPFRTPVVVASAGGRALALGAVPETFDGPPVTTEATPFGLVPAASAAFLAAAGGFLAVAA